MLNNTAMPVEENGHDASGNHIELDSETKSTLASNTNAPANRGNEKAKSAAAEIVVPQLVAKPDPVGDAIKNCKEVAKGESVFKASVAHIYEGLKAAYPIFLLIKDDKVAHQRAIDELMAKGDRERMPSLNKASLNATELACHPVGPEEHSNCSDWANVITLANIENISADDFPSWVQDKKIGESKRKVRAFKQAAKKASKPLKTPSVEGDFPALAYVFKHLDDQRTLQSMREALTDVNERVAQALAAMSITVA